MEGGEKSAPASAAGTDVAESCDALRQKRSALSMCSPFWLEVNVSDRSRNQTFGAVSWHLRAYLKFETFADIFAVKFKLTEMVLS